MADFSGDIINFQRYGTYTYKFDAVGNLTFDSGSSDFSRVYLSFPLRNFLYDPTKVESFYPTKFEEFVPPDRSGPDTGSIDLESQHQLDALSQENARLQSQLDTLTTAATENMTDAQILAAKQVILELRKMLGQGRVDSDFSDDFPYAPIRKEPSNETQ